MQLYGMPQRILRVRPAFDEQIVTSAQKATAARNLPCPARMHSLL